MFKTADENKPDVQLPFFCSKKDSNIKILAASINFIKKINDLSKLFIELMKFVFAI